MKSNSKKEIRLHLLKGSQQEHDKIWKEYSYIYGPDNPRTVAIQNERNKMTDEINKLLKELQIKHL